MVFLHRQVVLQPLPVVVILAVVELPLLVVQVPLAVVVHGLRSKMPAYLKVIHSMWKGLSGVHRWEWWDQGQFALDEPYLSPVVKSPSVVNVTVSLDRRRRQEGAPVFEVGLPARGPLGHDVPLLLEGDPRGAGSVVFPVLFRARHAAEERHPGGEVEVKDAGQRESVDGEEGAGQHGSRVSGVRRVEGEPPWAE